MAETDKSRELLIRELASAKDLEADKIRAVEARKEAELKLHEKLA